MRLTALRIDGFKSFAEAVDVPLRAGLTGVIGPNGCGKSNVTEAVRWVMGANSAQALRSDGMASVVFAGTGSASGRGRGRPPRSSAEVVIEGQLDGRPFEVSRRVTIGSDGEAVGTYRVDRDAALARDVRTLFASAGTGPASPALVQQMRIASLVSARPADRRSLLDQAAGVSGLDARRRAAEIQLDAADRELTHQAVRIDALTRQAEGLAAQARAAERHAELTRAAERAGIAAMVLRLREAADAFEAYVAGRDEAEATAAVARAERDDALAARDRLRSEEERARHVATEAGKAVADLTAQLASIDAERVRAEADRDRLEDRVESACRALNRERQLVEDAEGEAAAAQEKLSQSERRDELASTNGARDVLAAAETRAKAARQTGVEAARRLAAAEAAASARAEAAKRARADLAEARRRLRLAADEVDAAAARPRPAREDLDRAVQDAIAGLETARRAREAAEATIRAETASCEDARSRVHALARQRDVLTDEIRTLRGLIQDAEGSDLVRACEVEAGYEGALGAALGEGLLAGLDGEGPRYWDTIAGLESPGTMALPPVPYPQGAGLTPLTAHVRVPPALERAVGAVAVAANEAAAAAARTDLLPGQAIVTMDGGLWRWDGYVVRGGSDGAAQQLLRRQIRYDELVQERAGVLEALTKAKTASVDADERVAPAEDAAAAARLAEAEAVGTLRQAEAARSGAIVDADDVEQASQQARQAADLARADLARAEAAYEATAAEANDASTHSELRRAAEAATLTLQEAERERADAAAAARAEADQARAREARVRELRAALADWERRAERSRAEVRTQEEALSAARAALKAAVEVPGALLTERDRLRERLTNATDHRDATDVSLTAVHAGLAAAEKRVDETVTAAVSADRALDAARADTATASHRLDLLRRDANEACGTAEPDALSEGAGLASSDLLTPDAHDRQAAVARKALSELGPVNPVAEDDLADVRDELEQAEARVADVADASRELRAALDALQKEGRARLVTAFEAIEANFRSVYGALFEGGEARLELDGDDPLDAGLEVMASPAGKRLTALSLLSGGEQALTATALVCAAILTRPSPIVVLDEVDAPLDGPNVERFCQLLRMVSDASDGCFLVVTHQARTISAMDRLLTVEMPEPGVTSVRMVELNREADAVA